MAGRPTKSNVGTETPTAVPSTFKKYLIHTSNYKTFPYGRRGMPIVDHLDSPTFVKLKELEEDNKLGEHPEYGKKIPPEAQATVEALLTKMPQLDKKVRMEAYEAAEKKGKVADAQGRFHTDEKETVYEILEFLVPLDESLGLNFPYGIEIYLDRGSPKLDKERCMEIRKRTKAMKDAREGNLVAPDEADDF